MAASSASPCTRWQTGLGVPNGGAHAYVGRDLARFVNVVAHRHAVAASTTDHQPLQESRSFSGWARAPFGTVTLGRLVQLAQVLLVLSPGDVARMCVTNQDLPLIARQPLDVQVPACRGDEPSCGRSRTHRHSVGCGACAARGRA